jgi:hypothetical protein
MSEGNSMREDVRTFLSGDGKPVLGTYEIHDGSRVVGRQRATPEQLHTLYINFHGINGYKIVKVRDY